MIIFEILVIFMLVFLVFKIILLPSFSNKKIKINLNSESFNEIYNNFISKDFTDIKKCRNKILSYMLLSIIFLVITFLIFYISVMENVSIAYTFIALLFLLDFIALFFKYYMKFKKIYPNVISEFLRDINEDLVYRITPFLKEEMLYKETKFDNQEIDSFFGKDTIEQKGYPDKLFDLSNIKVKTGNNEFNGIFAVIYLDKNISSYTKINTENLEKNTNYTIGITSQDLKYIETDNANFNKILHVYSNNKINAMEILSSDILDYLVEFYNKYNVNFQIVFNGNKVYIRFFINQLFEPTIIGNILNKSNFILCYIIMDFSLKLNEKILNNMKYYEE